MVIKIKSFFKWIINFVLILILIFSEYNIYIKLSDYNKATNVYNDIREIKEDNKYDLVDINKDFKCWIKVDNTNIDYPVVQGSDNNYYLNKDFNGNNSGSGTIFIDSNNDIDNDENIILYGHNMKNKTMFNNLVKFKDEEFFKSNNKIRIFTDSDEYVFEVFSAYVAQSDDDYLKTSFNNADDFNKYIDYTVEKSLYKSNIDVQPSDKIITLSTCSYEFNDARTVVHAKLIKSSLTAASLHI